MITSGDEQFLWASLVIAQAYLERARRQVDDEAQATAAAPHIEQAQSSLRAAIDALPLLDRRFVQINSEAANRPWAERRADLEAAGTHERKRFDLLLSAIAELYSLYYPLKDADGPIDGRTAQYCREHAKRALAHFYSYCSTFPADADHCRLLVEIERHASELAELLKDSGTKQ